MGKRYTSDFKAKIAAEVKEGLLSIPAIAEKHSLNNSLIYNWLGRTGPNKKQPAPPTTPATSKHGGGRVKIAQNIRDAVLADVSTGLSVKTAARKHGVNYTTAYGWFRDRKRQVADTPKLFRNDSYLRDVATYLKHARTEINEDLRSGKLREQSRIHLLMLLALNELEKHGY